MPILLMVLVSIVFIVLNFNESWTNSVDFAHHYTLAARLADHGALLNFDPSLGVDMRIYPRYSHWVAVLLTTLLPSVFPSLLLSLHVVSFACLSIIWASIIILLFSLPSQLYLRIATFLAGLLALNAFFIKAHLFGWEIIHNFFYAQLVAQAFAFIIIVITLVLEKKSYPPFLRYIILAISVYATIQFHLLAGLELLGILWLLVLIESWQAQKGWIVTIKYALIPLLATGSLVTSSTFSNMYMLATNNGSLAFQFMSKASDVAIFATIVAGCSFFLLYQFFKLQKTKYKDVQAIKYIALLGITLSGLTLLQALAFWGLEIGSEYSIKKYGFALATVFLIEIVSLFGIWFTDRRFITDPLLKWRNGMTLVYQVSPALLLTLALFNISLNAQRIIHTPQNLTFLRNVETYIQQHPSLLFDSHRNNQNYAFGIHNLLSPQEYLISTGMLKTPRNANALNLLLAQPFSHPNEIHQIITSANSEFDLKECRQPESDTNFSVLDAACFFATFSPICHGQIDFSNTEYVKFKLQGFSAPETSGRWSDGNIAFIKCNMPTNPQQRPSYIRLLTKGFIYKEHTQRMLIRINDMPKVEFVYDKTQPEHEIYLPIPQDSDDTLTIQLEFPDAISPSTLNLSTDVRQLGVWFDTLQFE